MAPTTTSTTTSSSKAVAASTKPVAEKAVRSKAKESSDAVVSKTDAAAKASAAAATKVATAAAAAPAKSSSKAAAAPAAAKAPAPAVGDDAPAAVLTVKPSAASKLVDSVESLNAAIGAQDEIIKTLIEQTRAVRKLREVIGRHSANAKKAECLRVEKALKKKANGNPTGLKKPVLASDALNAFLGNPAGTEVNRVEAAAVIRAYIDAQKLKEGVAGGFAKLDAKLAKLFPGIAEIKIFSMQTYLKDHFVKKAAAAVAV